MNTRLNGDEVDQLANVDAAAKLIADRRERDRIAGLAFEGDYEARIIIDQQGVILHANERARLVTAHPDLIGKNFRILIPPRFADVHEKHFTGFLDDPRSRPMGVGLDIYMIDGRHTEKRIDLTLRPFEDLEGGSMKICIGINVPKAKTAK